MLQLTCRICLRMNVADLLHFQASLHADGIVDASSNKENIMGICIFTCKPLDTLLVIQHLADLVRQSLHLSKKLRHTALLQFSLDKSALDRQQIHSDQLCAVCLSRGNGNLRSCISIQRVITFSCNAGTNHIDNTKYRHISLLGKAKSSQTVRSLTGLGNDHNHGILCQDWIAVTELRSHIHLNRNSCHGLDHIFANHSNVISGTAGNNVNSLKRSQLLIGKACLRQIHMSVFHISTNSILNCLRLLMDLFEHKVLISAFFCCCRIPLDLHNILLDLLAVDIIEMDLITGKLCNLKIANIINSSCLIQNSRNIRCDQASGILLANDQRTILTGSKQFARIILKHHAKSIGTADTQHGSGNCLQRRSCFLIVIIYQLHSHFCIGL